jgi:hypothetical protein
MNIQQSLTSLKYLFAANLTPHLIGKHGVGKSSIVYQYAEANGYEVCEIRVGQMADPGDLVGLQKFTDVRRAGGVSVEQAFEATKHILPEWFIKATVPGAKVIIFVDELNRGAKDILQAIFELVYDRSLKGTKISADCHVVAASNPATDDYSVLDFSDAAFQDRFVHIKFEPTVQEYIAYQKAKSPNSAVADFIMEMPQMLENGDLQGFDLDFVKPSRRSWDRITMLEAVKTPADLELELFMGIVGTKAALAYTEFRQTNFKSIKVQDVLNDYAKLAKKNVKKAITNNRNDMLGTLLQELNDELLKMEAVGLTMEQANNLTELATDLPVEHAYNLAIIIKDRQKTTTNITNINDKLMIKKGADGKTIDYKKLGMFAHKEFTELTLKIKAKRDAVKPTEKQQESVPF